MTANAETRIFLAALSEWAKIRGDIRSLALAGSRARGTATPSSDIDLVILTDDPAVYLRDSSWASEFGIVERHQLEHYGRVTSMRVWYAGGVESEFGFTTPDWADEPLDPGTRHVIEAGLVVLWEREPSLALLVKHR